MGEARGAGEQGRGRVGLASSPSLSDVDPGAHDVIRCHGLEGQSC